MVERIGGLTHDKIAYPPRSTVSFRINLARFLYVQIRELSKELNRVGHAFLAGHGSHDEPLTWQPPIEPWTGSPCRGPTPGSLMSVTSTGTFAVTYCHSTRSL